MKANISCLLIVLASLLAVVVSQCDLPACTRAVGVNVGLRTQTTGLLWSRWITASARAGAFSSLNGTRASAILHTCIYDVVRSFEPNPAFNSFLQAGLPPPGADVDAAVNGAGFTVLSNLFPSELPKYALAARFHADLLRHRGVRINSYRSGFNFGANFGFGCLNARSNDGSNVNPTVTLSGLPGVFDCNFPNNLAAACPDATGWGSVTPFVIPAANVNNFVPTEGPSYDDPDQYESDYKEALGRGAYIFDDLFDVPKRTGTETFLAGFWTAEGQGTQGSGARYLQIAQDLAEKDQLPRFQTARLLALTSLALMDASVVAYRTKYNYLSWRPESGITEAATTPYTMDPYSPDFTPADPDWEPLGITPTTPDYISESAAYGGALEAVLRNYYGGDEYEFDVYSDQIPKVRARYNYFSDASSDSAASRVLLGETFRTSANDGLTTGITVGEYVFANALRPITPA